MILEILPKSNLLGVTITPFIITQPKPDKTLINHEKIHICQQTELAILSIIILLCLGCGWLSLLGYFTFYIIYLSEWVVKSLIHNKDAYHLLSSEIEAYNNEKDLNYLSTRIPFKWLINTIL